MPYLNTYEMKERGTFDFPIQLYYISKEHERYEMPCHWHMESEFILILQGELFLTVDNKSVNLQAGDSAFVPGGSLHTGIPKDCIYECIVLDLESFFKNNAICRAKVANLFNNVNLISCGFAQGSEAGVLLDKLFDAMEKSQPGYEFVATGLIWQFLGVALDRHRYVLNPGATDNTAQQKQKIKNVLLRIRTDFSMPLTLEVLASEVNVTPEYLCRIFKKVTGKTPIDYLNFYRIECAASMLCTENKSVTEVALSCGFNDLSYFARIFKKQKGVSALQYRKTYRI